MGAEFAARQFYAGREGPFTYHATWHDAPTLGGVNNLYRRLFWHDERHVDSEYLAPTYYLWHEMIFIPDVEGAVRFVQSHSTPEDQLFGESGLPPLIAFLADRDIAGFVVDTNTKRLSGKQTTVQQIINRIDTPALRFVIGSRTAHRHRYINRRMTKWLDRNFSIVYRFDSDAGSSVTNVVMERNTARRPTPEHDSSQ